MKYVLMVVLLAAVHGVALAQVSITDSLKNIYKLTPQDTSKIKLLLEMGDVWEFQNTDTALDYYKKALALADTKINENKGRKSERDYTILKASCLRYMGIVYMSRGKTETAEKCYKNALAADKKFDNYIGMAASRNNLGTLYYNLSRLDEAIDYYKKAIADFKIILSQKNSSDNLKAAQGTALCYNNIGNIYAEKSNYPKALEYYYLALKQNEKINFERGISACLQNIGLVHQDQGNFEEATRYLNKSLAKEIKLGNDDKVADIYLNIGINYWEESQEQTDTLLIRKKLDMALDYYKRALEIYRAMDNVLGLAKVYANNGVVFFDLGKLENDPVKKNELFEVSLDLYLKAGKLYEEAGSKNGLSSNNINLGLLYHRKKEYRKTIKLCHSSLLVADSTRQMIWKRNACDCISNAYFALNMFDSAYHYKMMYIETNDSVFSEEKSKVLAESEAKYEDEKKQILIDNLSRKKELNQIEFEKSVEKRTRQQIIIWVSVAGIVLLALFFIAIFRLYILKRRANKLLAEQKATIELKNSKLEQLNEEINAQKDEIEAQRDMVMTQKGHIEYQKKEITDSINYARNIQDAVLPSLEYLGTVARQQFVLTRPRDIVSGTFYWSTQLENRFVFVMAECPGYGVPGALMGMIGISYLNGSVKGNRIPAAEELMNGLENTIRSVVKSGSVKMSLRPVHLCFLSVDLKSGEMTCKSSGVPVFILKKGKLTEVTVRSDMVLATLDHDDVVFITTPGLINVLKGTDAFVKTITECNSTDLNEIKEKINKAVNLQLLGSPPDEDICLAGFGIV